MNLYVIMFAIICFLERCVTYNAAEPYSDKHIFVIWSFQNYGRSLAPVKELKISSYCMGSAGRFNTFLLLLVLFVSFANALLVLSCPSSDFQILFATDLPKADFYLVVPSVTNSILFVICANLSVVTVFEALGRLCCVICAVIRLRRRKQFFT